MMGTTDGNQEISSDWKIYYMAPPNPKHRVLFSVMNEAARKSKKNIKLPILAENEKTKESTRKQKKKRENNRIMNVDEFATFRI